MSASFILTRFGSVVHVPPGVGLLVSVLAPGSGSSWAKFFRPSGACSLQF